MHLSNESLLTILLVGLVAGWLAGQIMRGAAFGLIGDIVIGILGAFIGEWLLPRLGIHLGTGLIPEIVNATIGAGGITVTVDPEMLVDERRHKNQDEIAAITEAQRATEKAMARAIDLIAGSLTSASQAVARNERHAQLEGAIARLPAESRDVLRWRYVDGLPTKEIADKIGKTAIDGADFAVEVECEKHIVEGIDEVAITLLGALDDGEKLIHLAIAGRLGVARFEAFYETAQLGHFLSALPGVHTEQSHEDD